MPAPTDAKRGLLTDKVLPLNWRVALAKGWTWHERRWRGEEWDNPEGECDDLPDFVGTLAGMAGLLREIYEAPAELEVYYYPINDGLQVLLCSEDGSEQTFWSPWEKPGDCVGDAWLSVFEEKANNAN